VRRDPERPLTLVEWVVERVVLARVEREHPDIGSPVLRLHLCAEERIPDLRVGAAPVEARGGRPFLRPALQLGGRFRLDTGPVGTSDVVAGQFDSEWGSRVDGDSYEVLDE
jgi:hypothetical protein